MDYLLEVGTRIHNLRKKARLTQEELALKVGYTSRSSINKIEKGMVNLPQSKIAEIADALGTSPGYLMGWQDEPVLNETTDERHERWLKEFEKLSDNGKQLLLDSIKRLEALSPEQREIFLAMFQGALASQQKDQPK